MACVPFPCIRYTCTLHFHVVLIYMTVTDISMLANPYLLYHYLRPDSLANPRSNESREHTALCLYLLSVLPFGRIVHTTPTKLRIK